MTYLNRLKMYHLYEKQDLNWLYLEACRSGVLGPILDHYSSFCSLKCELLNGAYSWVVAFI